MKKTSIKFLLILFVATLVLEGCKKGENDPALSLRSRDARVTGEWKLVKMETTQVTETTVDSYNLLETRTESFNGTSVTATVTTEETMDSETETETETVTYSLTLELTINKDGTYSQNFIEDGVVSSSNGDRWSWLDSSKKKSTLALDGWMPLHVDRLANSEMILTYNQVESFINSDGHNTEESYSGEFVFEKQ